MKWLAALLILLPTISQAHDYWTNGDPVPDWIKESCCGKADANLLNPAQVHQDADGNFHIDGGYTVPLKQVLPSQDGHYWIFHSPSCTGENCEIYCFFAPLNF